MHFEKGKSVLTFSLWFLFVVIDVKDLQQFLWDFLSYQIQLVFWMSPPWPAFIQFSGLGQYPGQLYSWVGAQAICRVWVRFRLVLGHVLRTFIDAD